MRVLWVTNMWPDTRRPWLGSFVFSQAESVRHLVDLDVISIPGYRGKHEYLRGAATFAKALRSSRYDVVHAHYGYCGMIARLQVGVPVIVSYCGDDLLGTPLQDGTFSRSSKLLASSFAQLARVSAATITKSEEMARKLPAQSRARNHVIPNGVDLTGFAPMDRAEARRLMRWSNDKPNVLFVGNPRNPRKNFALASAVCDELARRGTAVALRVAWEVGPREMPVWMNAADVLLFPSVSEGSPNTVKEAMATELPIVSAPVGDVPERLAGVAGTFVVKRMIEPMANAVASALEVGRTPAARIAVNEISTERVAARVVAVYSQATSSISTGNLNTRRVTQRAKGDERALSESR